MITLFNGLFELLSLRDFYFEGNPQIPLLWLIRLKVQDPIAQGGVET
jgi:hypothetical protein